MADDEQAIRDLVATWLHASMAGDTTTVLRLMAEDVVFLRPGHEPMRGRAPFAALQQSFKPYKLEADSQIQEVRVSGEWAYCWSRLSIAVTPQEGSDVVQHAGDVLSVLQKQTAGWVIVRDANMLTVVPNR